MEQSNKRAPSQKNSGIVSEMISIKGFIPAVGNPAGTGTNSLSAAAGSAAEAIPVLGDPMDASKKAETSIEGFVIEILCKLIQLIKNIMGKMKIGADRKYSKLKQAVEGTNPNYKPDEHNEWSINCQRCVSAFEARMRGMDVTAKPSRGEDDLFGVLYDQDGYVLSVYKSPVIENVSADTGADCRNKINKHMEEWGEGARAIVRVRWDEKWGGGHAFSVVQINGETHYVDPQTGQIDCGDYFDLIDPSETRLIRVDNLDFDEGIHECIIEK